jgi:putative radical SAM enzyme (TIGR03279 family)
MAAPLLKNRTKQGKASTQGVRVNRIESDSPAARAGLATGDLITHVDGKPIRDFLDFYIASFRLRCSVRLLRRGGSRNLELARRRRESTGIEIEVGKLIGCNNKCIFCFVDQLPEGLRRDLYLKDGDYRLSFLHGNYLTLTNLTREHEQRICEMHLSPLYVSVHATDSKVRARLLGRHQDAPILGTLDRLACKGIKCHAQIVIVPGINDGNVLEATLKHLCERHQSVLSVSVIPVGLTSHRQGLHSINPVGEVLAVEIVQMVDDINHHMRQVTGRGMVYASDELIILSRQDIPGTSYYDDYPQIENGVGLLRAFLEGAGNLRIPRSLRYRRLVFLTGSMASPYLEDTARGLERRGITIKVVALENSLFGPSVTVSGLLSGNDIMLAASAASDCDAIVLPPAVLNEEGMTLDGIGLSEIADAAGVPVIPGDYDLGKVIKDLAVFLGKS